MRKPVLETEASGFPGSRWWKCDLHTHTPASYDFTDKTASAADWVTASRAAGLDAVAVTDHNTHRWIAEVQKAAEGTGLVIFPGAEITVDGGIHLLAILPPEADPDAVVALLGECQIPAAKFGLSDTRSPLTFLQVAEIVTRRGGVTVGAHVDDTDGFLKRLVTVRAGGNTAGDGTLKDIVRSLHLYGAEIKNKDTALLAYLDNTKTGYERPDGPLAQLEGSDTHALNEVGRRWTWIKMSRPDIVGLRLALMDGELSVRRGGIITDDPNTRAADLIEAIEVEHARYMGRGKSLRIELNPWLNAVIGGHGTGKSSLVEFLRLALRREGEILKDSSLREELKKYAEVYGSREEAGLLTENAVVRVLFRRDGERYRIQWSPQGDVEPIEELDVAGKWTSTPGEVAGRFPVRIFSQKQIYKLAEKPNALLIQIDDSRAVDAAALRAEMEREEKSFLGLRAQARAIDAELRDEARLQGTLADVKRKLAVFEASGHRDVLTAYQTVERQQGALDGWVGTFEEAVVRLEALPDELATEELPAGAFPEVTAASAAERAALKALAEATRQLEDLRTRARSLAADAHAALAALRTALAGPPWSEHVVAERQRYEALKGDLVAAGAGDPSGYGRLVQESQTLEARLKAMDGRRKAKESLERQAREGLTRMSTLRAELTERRRRFLSEVLADNVHVSVQIVPYGDDRNAVSQLRECIERSGDTTFEDQIWGEDENRRGVLRVLYEDFPPDKDPEGFASGLAAVKARLIGVASGIDDPALHGKFQNFLRRLPPEGRDRVEAMFPEDSVSVSYRPRPAEALRPIDQGSPGQKSAAILAFLLSHGTQPLVLDQPEDDLDNQVISELIVAQLRQIKTRRQVIVVTHNANIVVNGDAELVVSLVTGTGQTHVETVGGLQEEKVRGVVGRVMEGGLEALERRYRRIRAGMAHA